MRPVPNHAGGPGGGPARRESGGNAAKNLDPAVSATTRLHLPFLEAAARTCGIACPGARPRSRDLATATRRLPLICRPRRGRDSDRGEPSREAMVALPGRAG
jgi:hypothetical protein